MKYVLVADMHGTDLSGLEQVLLDEKPDRLLCLGDFDQTGTIHQFMELEKQYKTLTIPGNHDHAILNGIIIFSPILRREGKTSDQLYYELLRDRPARRWIEKLVKPKNFSRELFLDIEKYGNSYRTVMIHGAFAGSTDVDEDLPAELWTRLTFGNDYERNFDAMDQKGYQVMLRGHDHSQSYVYRDPEKGIVHHRVIKPRAFRLYENRLHTINPGALYDGNYAIIDTAAGKEKAPLVSYCRL